MTTVRTLARAAEPDVQRDPEEAPEQHLADTCQVEEQGSDDGSDNSNGSDADSDSAADSDSDGDSDTFTVSDDQGGSPQANLATVATEFEAAARQLALEEEEELGAAALCAYDDELLELAPQPEHGMHTDDEDAMDAALAQHTGQMDVAHDKLQPCVVRAFLHILCPHI